MDVLSDSLGVWLAALLTIMVLLYILRIPPTDFLFRLAQSLLVGTAIGYSGAVILRNVLWDGLLTPLATDPNSGTILLVPLVLGLFLLTKLRRSWNTPGNIALGYLFGVGAALAIGGALNGAVSPQLSATILSIAPAGGPINSLNNLLIVVGTLGALLAFRFTTGQRARSLRIYARVADVWGRLGRGFIMVAFGAILANVLAARISTLVGQLYFLAHDWLNLVK